MGMFGVFVSLDYVLFYVFCEIGLLPMYFLIAIWGQPKDRPQYAAIKFFLYTLVGSVAMLLAILGVYFVTGTFDIVEAAKAKPFANDIFLGSLAFWAFFLGFAIKVPSFPFHTWLPDAHTEAPTSGSVVLAGVLLKMGTYGLLRFCIHMLPGAAVAAQPVMMALGAIGIVYGALLAWAQTDLKRLIACSSVSHLGYVVLGLFALTPAGLSGGMLQMVNHGISTGLLFLLVGMIYERRHTRALEQFGGIATVMPVFALFWVFTVLSSVGLPGLNGFVGEYLILLGSFQSAPLWSVIGLSGVIFGAVYLLMATRKVLFGSVTIPANRTLADLNGREIALMLPLVALAIWIGVRPTDFTRKAEPGLALVSQRVLEAQQVRTASLTNESPLTEGVAAR